MSRSLPFHQSDVILIWSFVILIFLGLLMLFFASLPLSYEKTKKDDGLTSGNPTYYLLHQILYGLLPGLILAYFFSKISLDFLKRIAPLFFGLAFICLVLVFIPGLGFEAGGAARWLQIGNFTFQPSEFAKLALIVYLAALFEKKVEKKKISSFKDCLVPLLIILLPLGILLLLQPDMGTLGVLCLIVLCMFFGIGGSFLHTFLIILLGLSVLCICVFFIFPYQAERVLTFLNPTEDTSGSAYQINQSLIALGSGGIFGGGLGSSIQKWGYLPQPTTDTIFAIWAEDTGFIGSLIVISLYLIICWRGFIIAKRAPTKFSQGLAIGIVSWISIQVFLHIMALCGLIPFTGIPLPFVSYGGTALIFNLIGMGILINISKRTV